MTTIVCPECGSQAVYQHWWHRADGAGGTVPVCPSTEDELWNCTACGAEFEVGVAPVEKPPVKVIFGDNQLGMTAALWFRERTPDVVRADTGGGKTNSMEILQQLWDQPGPDPDFSTESLARRLLRKI